MKTKSGRVIIAEQPRNARTLFLRWESLLLILFIAVNIMNINLSSNYLNAQYLFTNINSFLVKGFIVMPMAFILLMGDIDLSVGSTVCLAATILGVTYNATGSIVLGILAAILTGLACGALNGLILVKFPELFPMIVTLGTMTLYRGLSERILGDSSISGMRNVEWFTQLYDARIGPVPCMFIVFCVLVAAFGFVMHKTTFGRHMYAIGANKEAAEYAGINVKRIRMIVFTLSGLICGIAAVFYCSWMGTVKSNVADGYEMEAIAMCVLGGVSTAGGKGNFAGVVIATFIIGLLRYGLGLINVNAQTIRIIIGLLLIIVVLLQKFKTVFKKKSV